MHIRLSEHFSYSKLLKFTCPSVAMMIFTSVYGVVDGFFVSNYIGKLPFAAVNLIMPILMILATTGFIFGTGGSAIVAKTIGEGNPENANKYFSLFVYVSFAIGVLFALLGIIYIENISILIGAEGVVLEHCVLYGRIILLALPFYVLQLLFQSFFVTAEKPQLGLTITVISGLTNIILDALLVAIFPFGIKGAAIATGLSQVVGGIIPIFYFSNKNKSLLKLTATTLNIKILIKACINGSSEFMSNISMSLVGILYNIQLLKYAGENGVAAYGVMMYVSFIFASVYIGYSMGIAPVIGYNDGAKNFNELKSLLRKSISIIGFSSIIMTALGITLSDLLASIFVGYDTQLHDMTKHGFMIFSISFLFMGYAIFSSGFFTALNDGVTSAIISFLRTLVFQVAAVLILPIIFDINGIWISISVAELMAVLISCYFIILKRKKYHY